MKTKKLLVRKGNGQLVETRVTLYWSESLRKYVSVPE